LLKRRKAGTTCSLRGVGHGRRFADDVLALLLDLLEDLFELYPISLTTAQHCLS